MAEKYSFVTKWKMKALLQNVWDAIYNSLEWPQWWKGVAAVKEIQPNDVNGINGIRNYKWKSVLPYTLDFNMRLRKTNRLKALKGLRLASWKVTANGCLKREMKLFLFNTTGM